METFVKVVLGVFVLIAIYLFLVRGRETVGIIQAGAGAVIQGIRVLQGRG